MNHFEGLDKTNAPPPNYKILWSLDSALQCFIKLFLLRSQKKSHPPKTVLGKYEVWWFNIIGYFTTTDWHSTSEANKSISEEQPKYLEKVWFEKEDWNMGSGSTERTGRQICGKGRSSSSTSLRTPRWGLESEIADTQPHGVPQKRLKLKSIRPIHTYSTHFL